MKKHIGLGKKGEELAIVFLAEKGYTILHRNWRFSHYEIDIIALKDGMPHFVEVKFRSSEKFAWPEESVRRKKKRDLLKAIEEFMFLHREYRDFRIDILSISMHANKPRYFFIEDIH